MRIREPYRIPGHTVVVAHRGFSARFPENTLTAFREALAIGADIIEFDLRETADHELVVIHDETLDRTTNGHGPVSEKTLRQIQALNASFWRGPHDTGTRLANPTASETIPTFEELLDRFATRACMNIQVYVESRNALEHIVALYRKHHLFNRAFLMLKSFAQAEDVRSLCRDVQLCVGEDRDDLAKHLRFGVDFLQPMRRHLSPGYLARARYAGIPVNVFYANEIPIMRELVRMGVPGILTDYPDRLIGLRRGV